MSDDSGPIWSVLVVCGLGLWWWNTRDSDDNARQHASTEYALPANKIEIEGKQPHDCEFSTAPIGQKHCSYKRVYEAEWITLSADNPPLPISYGTLQEKPPIACSQDPSDLMHKCYYTELPPGERATRQWSARHVQIRWKKVDE